MSLSFQECAELYYRKFGFTIIRIGSDKKPFEKSITDWFEQDRNIEELNKLKWNSELLSGIGVILKKQLLALDFDKVNDIKILEMFIEDAELENDYKWIVQSGSGFHVYVLVENKEKITKELGEGNILYYYPNNKDTLDHIEIRLSNCYIILPPSIHPKTNKEYEFKNGFPDYSPMTVKEGDIIDYVNKYFKRKKESIEKSDNKFSYDNYDAKNLNKAIDYIKKDYFNYKEWNKLCFALASTGEKGREPFIRLSKNIYWDTSIERINEEFDNCLKNFEPTRSNLGTLFKFAIKRGFKTKNKRNKYSGIFYEFKLCLLQLPEEGLIIKIINYSIFRKVIEELHLSKKKEIEKYFLETFELKLSKEQYKTAKGDYKKLKKFSDDFESRNKADAYCRIGKDFFNDVLNQKYTLLEFRVLASIQGILGKSAIFKPIGKNRIKYAIKGYKKASIATQEGNIKDLISDSTLKRILKKLEVKNFFRKRFYSKEAFYSTKLDYEDLDNAISKYLAERKKRYLKTNSNTEFRERIRKEFNEIEEDFGINNKEMPDNVYKLSTSK